MANKKTANNIQETAEKIVELLGIKGEVEVFTDGDSETTTVSISTNETGILIGRHGETISAFELLLNQIINRGKEEWQRILVDTGDYRAKQEDRLRALALDTAQKVKDSGSPYSLYDLSAPQRRIVHMILAEDSEILTESEGEGRERRLVVKLRS